MTYQRFTALAKRARATRTKEDTLVLLADYAESQCATYPADSDLFLELWPDANPPGFVLHEYASPYGPCHVVRRPIVRAEPDSSCLYANAVLATCEACDKDVATEDICSETGDYRCKPCCPCTKCQG